ncbi:YfhO family protein [Frondihabitans sp. PAMC 28766]|uniref:YfhO family protein n=1 Tax=Frondihabitans sp. PAMC 28766 TaxID=1795630 RepID=UPI0012FFC638|nr:YfhO family protein [Frondihabitans sp. PAMC 28766]
MTPPSAETRPRDEQAADEPRPGRRSRFSTWLRTPGAWIEIAAWAALVAFVVFSLGIPLLGQGTFLNTAFLHDFAPWSDAAKSATSTSNVYDSDTIDSGAPQVALLVRLAHEGVFAQWNPYLSGGTELGGLPDSGAYSPLSLPWWILPLSYAPGVVKLLEIVVVTVGMALLLRRYSVPRAGWPIAALVFSSSGFMVAWTNWPQTRVAAFIPLLFWAIDRAAAEKKARDIISVGVALACMLLGGFPAVVGYTLFVGAFYFVVRTIVAHPRMREMVVSLGIVVGGLLFGVLLAAWQIVPFAHNALSVINFGVRAQSGGSGALGIGALVTSWLADAESEQSRGPIFGGGNPTEIYSYVGAAAVVLVAAAVLIRSRSPHRTGAVPLLIGLLALSVILVFLGGPLLAAVRHLPVFDSNPIGRMRCDVGFFAAALAGIGLGKLVEPENLRAEFARVRRVAPLYWIGRAAVAMLVLAAAAWIIWQTREILFPISAEYVHQVKLGVLWTGGVAGAAVILVLLAWILRSRIVGLVAGVGIIALVAVPAITSVQAWWPVASDASFYPNTPALNFLKKNLTAQQRFATSGQSTLPGTASYYQVRSLTGHTFQTTAWKQLMTAVDPASATTPTYSTLSPGNLPRSITSPILDRLGTRYVINDPSYPLVGTGVGGPAPVTTDSLTSTSTSVNTTTWSGPVNGFQFAGPANLVHVQKGMELTVSLIADGTGKTLASTTTWVQTFQGARWVALKGDSIPTSTSWHARISITGIPTGKSVQVGTTSAGLAAVNIYRPTPGADVRVVHTGDATIYQLLDAGDRVHWASNQSVETTAKARIATLQDPATPADEVVLSSPTTHQADPQGTASLKLDASDVNATVVHVNATLGGWVVVEDSLQRPGWSATVDGKATDLVTADNAGAAVWVPKGEHTVDLQYSTPGLGEGVVLTVASIVIAAIVSALVIVLGRRKRPRGRLAARPRQ